LKTINLIIKTKTLVQISLAILLTLGMYAQEFKEVGKIVDKNIAINANLGSSFCIYKDLAIIGAPHEHFDANGEDSVFLAGAVYVFSYEQNGNWDLIQKIVAPDRNEYDQFGSSLSFSDKYLIIGANINNYCSEFKDSLKNSGSVYIYKIKNGFWQFMQKLTAPVQVREAYYGGSVDISDNYAIVGAFHENDTSGKTISNVGAAYIYKCKEDNTWDLAQKLVAPDRNNYSQFGSKVYFDNNITLIGAPGQEGGGAVYIFELNGDGIWNQLQKLVASDRNYHDYFGYSFDISGDFMVIGSPFKELDNEKINNYTGAAYVFERDAIDSWGQVKKLTPSDNSTMLYYGFGVGIIGDNIIIGAPDFDAKDSIPGAGRVYLVNRNGGTWNNARRISETGRGSYNQFGYIIDISEFLAIIKSSRDLYVFEGKACISLNISDPKNIIENGDFESCIFSPWSIYLVDPIVNTINPVLVDGELVLTGITPGKDSLDWQIQVLQTFNQAQLDRMEEGATYELSFDARAEAGRKDLYVFLGQNEGGPWTACVHETIAVGAEKEHFSFEFTLNSVLPLMRILFGVGHEPAGLTIDNVRLVKIIPSADNELVVTNSAFHIYPNPAHDLLHVETVNGLKVTIISMFGIVMKTVPVNDKHISMDIQHLPKGVYMVIIEMNDFVYQDKIIIQ
jgi:hypothetical protein